MALWPVPLARRLAIGGWRRPWAALGVALLVLLVFVWPLTVRPIEFLDGVAAQQRFHHERLTGLWTHAKVAAFYARSALVPWVRPRPSWPWPACG